MATVGRRSVAASPLLLLLSSCLLSFLLLSASGVVRRVSSHPYPEPDPEEEEVVGVVDSFSAEDDGFRVLELDRIRNLLLEGLGLERPTDMSKMNISAEEMERGLRVYRQSVEESRRRARDADDADDDSQHIHQFYSFVHQGSSSPTSRRQRRSTAGGLNSQIWRLNFSMDVGEIDSPHVRLRPGYATLRLHRHPDQDTSASSDSTVRVYQRLEASSSNSGEDADGEDFSRLLLLDARDASSWPSGEFAHVDVSRALEQWLRSRRRSSHLTLVVETPDEVRVSVEQSDNVPVLNVMVKEQRLAPSGSGRVRRSAWPTSSDREAAPGKTDCGRQGGKENKRCCRRSMKVVLKDLEGFEFILQPAEFDAFYCRGRCPSTFRLAHDHALLQGLLHKKDKKKIPRPCCAPTKLGNLDILYADDKEPTKMKVTQWKNVIVRECGCS